MRTCSCRSARLVSFPAPASQAARAVSDIVEGARAVHLWGPLGWQDIRKRYRRSILGPFWLTISMGMLVGALGLLYGALFKGRSGPLHAVSGAGLHFLDFHLESYFRFLSSLHQCPRHHRADRPASFGACLPHGVAQPDRVGPQPHHFVPIAIAFLIWPGWTGLLIVPGLVLLCLNGVWAGLLLGLVSARFRDVPLVVDSVIRIAFFVTPIIWMPDYLPSRFRLHD